MKTNALRRSLLLSGLGIALPGAGQVSRERKHVVVLCNEGHVDVAERMAKLAAEIERSFFVGVQIEIARWSSTSEGANSVTEVAKRVLMSRPAAIIALSSVSVNALLSSPHKTSIPVVYVIYVNPVAQGYALSLLKPGGQSTGLSITSRSNERFMALVSKLWPTARHVGFLEQGKRLAVAEEPSLETMLLARGVQFHRFEWQLEPVEDIVSVIAKRGIDRVFVSNSIVTHRMRAALASAFQAHRISTIGGSRALVEAGLLACLYSNAAWVDRRLPFIVGKILLGADPAQIPVESNADTLLGLNVRVAEELGLRLSRPFLGTVDEFFYG